MPTIYDNIENPLIDGLREMLEGSRAADFCVGYFNLRGWGKIADDVEKLSGGCRLLIGMSAISDETVRRAYNAAGGGRGGELTQDKAVEAKKDVVKGFAKQLELGCPKTEHEESLKNLEQQLRDGKLKVKFHGRYPLHAKLYLAHRQDSVAALAGLVGSSNLTLAGLEKNGELNIDVLDQDAAKKLAAWFEDRWDDGRSIDVSFELAEVIKKSWASGSISPYHIYLKTAWHLSQDAMAGAAQYPLPRLFRSKMLDFQARGVELAAALLDKQNGVIIGDVVGLGKTMIASAVAKTFQDRDGSGGSVLIICPPKLESMWNEYLRHYQIAGRSYSNDSAPLSKLSELRRYKIIIVDESHNFRNRDSKRFGYLRDYIAANDSRVILLTATPYNKAFIDIANQLRLFIRPDKDLGTRPDNMIREEKGIMGFKAKYSDVPPSSLLAFELSGDVDDWRGLMKLFMVRRTRAHIKAHYAEYDEEKERHYLNFCDGEKFYFPHRKPRRLSFSLADSGGKEDDYAKLYSRKVVDIIGKLLLPRYGLAEYLDETVTPSPKEKEIIDNLTRAGRRLRGFMRSGLFKRLESGGDAFLLSIERHIYRNNVYLTALAKDGGALPIGQIEVAETEEAAEGADNWLGGEEFVNVNIEDVLKAMRAESEKPRRKTSRPKHKWIDCSYFKDGLVAALKKDNALLEEIHALVPVWKAENDRKLQALLKLVQKTHSKDKVLIFSQYKDTTDYLHRELEKEGVQKLAVVHGSSKNVQDIVNRFSPHANNSKPGASELRVLIATDALSEGQNLQDSHIVVNYDLPWAIIRLIQRVGRVDRIGQKSSNIYCYSAMPEEGIEQIITLRKRLKGRMQESEELIGSDERFFEGDKPTDQKQLQGLYDGTANLEEPEDETDLISRAYDIWQRAIKDNPALEKTIEELPKVVYSAKAAEKAEGVIAYIRDGRGHDVLAHIGENSEIVSQAQAHILEMLECTEDEKPLPRAKNHHDLVGAGVSEMQKITTGTVGGQLGGKRSVRHRLYDWLSRAIKLSEQQPLLYSEEEKQQLRQASQDVYKRPLTETARNGFRQMFGNGASDVELWAALAHYLKSQTLCFRDNAENRDVEIICSMGLRK